MEEFIDFCNSEKKGEKEILKKISKIHFDFVKIHPFLD
jgi:Fic family protein